MLRVLSKPVQVCVRDLDFSTLWSEASGVWLIQASEASGVRLIQASDADNT